MPENIEELDPLHYIIVKGARVNNLKGVDVALPRNKLIVITGVSGSGKSSLAFDTLFAEGQRMYVESLSSYARQFLGRMEKPEVEYIKGVSPAIAVDQKVATRNPRSTVGTSTEIYDYLKLLFARIGRTYSPVSGQEVSKDTVGSVVNELMALPEGTRLIVQAPWQEEDTRTVQKRLEVLLQQGYSRVVQGGKAVEIESLLEAENLPAAGELHILIDRLAVQQEEETQFRLADSLQTAFYEGHGELSVQIFPAEGEATTRHFSERFELDGIHFEQPSVNLFSFNNPYGACRTCEGFGNVLGVDEDLVVPNPNLSLFEGAVAPWRSEGKKQWQEDLVRNAHRINLPIHQPYGEMSQKHRDLLWEETKHFKGVNAFFDWVQTQMHKVQYRVMLSRYRGRTACPSCKGTRVRKDTQYVKINDVSITDLVLMPLDKALETVQNFELEPHEQKIADRLLKEVIFRLEYLHQVGLNYLTLNRLTSSLSGGEFQRIRLATSLGSALVGSMYVLDEPSIGLHPRDTQQLIKVLEQLRDIGNTVVVVEHEEDIMRAADQLIDIGPDAGKLGGELVFQGHATDLDATGRSHTARFLHHQEVLQLPANRRKASGWLHLKGARENNLKQVDFSLPLGTLTAITGVSGSGKSTLIRQVFYPALARHFGVPVQEKGKFESLEGDLEDIAGLEFVDQDPIGKSSRSNPVTYVKAYDHIRQLYADQALSQQRGYPAGYFSFNVPGGRCDNCEGEGQLKVEMQFMADIYLTCENCNGQRFKSEILDVEYKGKHIADLLELTVDEAVDFFADQKKIYNRLLPLQEVGLGYIKLGQSSNTLSGGEAQRVKLAAFLERGNTSAEKNILFIFDEPTTGLHFHDISKLLASFNALIDQGHSVLLIEHNMDVIAAADHVIDLGPGGGSAGGNLTFAGTPEALADQEGNYTGGFLAEKLAQLKKAQNGKAAKAKKKK